MPNTVINFHAIQDPKWLNTVLIFLKQHYHVISINEMKAFYHEKRKVKNSCHITFDDGDISFYHIVMPLLKKYNIPASIYVSPLMVKQKKNFWFQEILGYDAELLRKIILKTLKIEASETITFSVQQILKSLPLDAIWDIIYQYRRETDTPPKPPLNMTVRQLLDIQNTGLVTIGAHTLNHPILSNETDACAEYEIKRSISDLGDILNIKTEYFAFPNGNPQFDFSEREIKFLKDSEIKLAFSLENKRFSPKDHFLSIPRIDIEHGNSLFILIKILIGGKWRLFKKIVRVKNEEDRFNSSP